MANTNQGGGDLQGKTRSELEQMAKDIPGIAQSKMSKEELISAIEQNRGGGNKKNQ